MLHHNDMGISLDCSVSFEDLKVWESSIHAMLELEKGAIANPTENRQVGHYWLRNPTLIGEEQERLIESSWTQLESVLSTLEHRHFTDLLMVGIGGSALGPQLLVEALSTRNMKVSFLVTEKNEMMVILDF